MQSQNEKPSNENSMPISSPKTKLLTWHPVIMDIDDPKANPKATNEENPGSSQPNFMEEDSEGLDLGELDILGLEDACRRKDFEKINPHQIGKLEMALTRFQQQKKIGVQLGSHWDNLKVTKESKKRGRKPYWQCTITVGEML